MNTPRKALERAPSTVIIHAGAWSVTIIQVSVRGTVGPHEKKNRCDIRLRKAAMRRYHGVTLSVYPQAAKEDATPHLADPADLSEEDLKRFTCPAFRENVACALTACTLLGIPRDIALQGMATAAPDPGVMRVYRLKVQGKTLYCVNAFAANDPVSTLAAWEFLTQNHSCQFLHHLPVIGLFNHRSDRGVRTKELLTWIPHSKIPLCHIVVLGPLNFLTTWYLRRQDFSRARIHHVRRLRSPRALLEDLSRFSDGDSVLFGFGNIKGAGQQLLAYFEAHGERIL